jgi:hypothetical protein
LEALWKFSSARTNQGRPGSILCAQSRNFLGGAEFVEQVKDLALIIEIERKQVAGLLDDDLCRLPLEAHALPQYLMAQRWYAVISDVAPIVAIQTAIPVPGDADAMVLILGVRADQEPEANYLCPIRTIWECERPPGGIVCEVRSGSTTGWVVEGFTDDRFVRSVLDNICRAPNTPGEASGLVLWRSQTFKPDDSFAAESAIGRSGAEQSNKSVVAGDVILKAFRKLQNGVASRARGGKVPDGGCPVQERAAAPGKR